MEYGKFSDSIHRLQDRLQALRAVWQDPTAASYDTINENMEAFTATITSHQQNTDEGYAAVKTHYNEEECESALRHACSLESGA